MTAGRKTHVDPNRRRLRFSRRSTFDLSRYMGASLTMIDRHYGHLARDGREHAAALLDSHAAEEAAAAAWTLGGRRDEQPEGSWEQGQSAPDRIHAALGGRLVDVERPIGRPNSKRK